MRILLGGAAAAALTIGSMSGAFAGCKMSNMMSHSIPHCTAKTGPVVWYMASAKTYYVKGSARYGKGMGMYVCKATAVARGGHPGVSGTMGAHGMPAAQTMMPRPMSSAPSTMTSPGGAMATPMPRTTGGPGLPGSTNAAPGSQGSPRPMTSGNPTSGNQGNTGAPGAGGQVPNNPASSSNSNPNPSPSPHP